MTTGARRPHCRKIWIDVEETKQRSERGRLSTGLPGLVGSGRAFGDGLPRCLSGYAIRILHILYCFATSRICSHGRASRSRMIGAFPTLLMFYEYTYIHNAYLNAATQPLMLHITARSRTRLVWDEEIGSTSGQETTERCGTHGRWRMKILCIAD